MRIRSVSLLRAHLPFHAPFRISLSVSDGTDNIFVRIDTDEGVTGWGEASPSPAITGDTTETMWAAGSWLARDLPGADPLRAEALVDGQRAVLDGHPTMRSALDMALYDIASQAAEQPPQVAAYQ